MDALTFTRSLKTAPPQAVYLFHGEEEYATEQCLQHLLSVAQPDNSDTDRDTFTAGGDVAAWTAALASPPWLSARRVVLVRDEALWKWNADSANFKALKAAVSSPTPDSLLCIIKRGKADARTAVYKLLKPFEVYCPPYNAPQAAAWVQKNATKAGAKCDLNVANLLVMRAGTELWTLRQELDKLLAYTQHSAIGAEAACQTPRVIDEAAVQAISVKNPQYKIFELTDSLAEGRTARALQLLQDALSDGEAPMMMLSLLGRHLTQLLAAATAAPGADLAGALGVLPFVVQKLRRQAAVLGVAKLRTYVAKAAEAEDGLKSGLLRNDRLVLEGLVLALCQR